MQPRQERAPQTKPATSSVPPIESRPCNRLTPLRAAFCHSILFFIAVVGGFSAFGLALPSPREASFHFKHGTAAPFISSVGLGLPAIVHSRTKCVDGKGEDGGKVQLATKILGPEKYSGSENNGYKNSSSIKLIYCNIEESRMVLE